MRRVFWLDTGRFDVRVDKSTYIEMSNELLRHGLEVIYITGYKVAPYFSEKIKYRLVSFGSVNLAFFYRIIFLMKALVFLMKEVRWDDVLFVQPDSIAVAWIIKKLKRAGVHLDFRTLPVDIHSFKQKLDNMISWKLALGIFLSTASSYSFITESLKTSVEEEFHCKFADYALWSSGVNTKLFKWGGEKEKNGRPVLLYHGSVSRNRGIGTAIQAVHKVCSELKKEVVFRIVGDGSDLDIMKNMTKEIGMEEHVQFTGLIPYEKVPSEISRADICICPLPDRLEWNVSSPLKIFEYLASGKPVICTPIPAHKNVIGDLPCVVYSEGEDADSIANAIGRALDSLHTITSNSEKGKKLIDENYTWERQGNILAAYLEKKYGTEEKKKMKRKVIEEGY